MKQLTDLEICKRTAEIEGKVFDCESLGNVYVISDLVVGSSVIYNPIKNDALNLKLRDKYCVQIRYDGECIIFDENSMFIIASVEFDDHKKINAAVCLVIIEANKNAKK